MQTFIFQLCFRKTADYLMSSRLIKVSLCYYNITFHTHISTDSYFFTVLYNCKVFSALLKTVFIMQQFVLLFLLKNITQKMFIVEKTYKKYKIALTDVSSLGDQTFKYKQSSVPFSLCVSGSM